MGAPRLRVVLAENGLTETGLTLRSLCAESGRVLELVRVESGEELEQALRSHCPDIALLQLSLLQPDAAHQLRVLQKNSPAIPFILLAEPADNVSAETCFALGAADYLVEGYLDERTMNRVLCSAIGESWPNRAVEMEHGLSAQDVEPNHLGHGWSRKGEREWMFTLMMGDAGQMEAWFGTEVISQAFGLVGDVMRKSVRSTDSVEATSGGELVVRIRGMDEAKRAVVQKRIIARLASEALPLLRQLNLEIQAVDPGQNLQGNLLFAVVPVEEGTPDQQRSWVC